MKKRLSPVVLVALACAGVPSSQLQAQSAAARLVNISTRGQVGTDANILIGGFVIGGGASKTVQIRAVGPGLAGFGVTGTVPDPVLNVFDAAGATIATNDNWNAIDAASSAQVGAFPLVPGSRDAVVTTTLPPGSYTAQISGLGATRTGVALLEIYDVSGGGQIFNIATRLTVGTGLNAAIAGFVVAPGAGTRKLLIRGVGPALAGFGVPGTLPDPKLMVFDSALQPVATAVANGSVTALASATAQAGAFATSAGDAATIVTVNPGGYTVQLSGNNGSTTGVGLIEVYDITNSTGTPANLASATPSLYYANLRPSAGAAATSTASGYAAILYDPNTNVATVSVNFSNLSSSATSAHLVVGASASSSNFALDLPRGQANALTRTFPSTGPYSTADLVTALRNGQLFVSIDSASFPGGELQGGFALTIGSTSFVAPAAPPSLPANALTAPTQTDAARLLQQASFGPTVAEINKVMARGINGWIDDQMALPATSALGALRADLANFPNPEKPVSPTATAIYYVTDHNWSAAWWKTAITGPDQLRQRVAFALSEILVIGGSDVGNTEPKTKYFDILINQAFGNYRQILEDVTLNPMMGTWLSHIKNQKADPIKGTAPDENYAREVQQLFTIGLVQLQPDGTLMLDAGGQPIPTYNQATISETAKVFTGWAFAIGDATTTNVGVFLSHAPNTNAKERSDTNAWLLPMRYFDAFHDKTQKRIVSLQQVPLANAAPTVIPAGQTGPQDLRVMLDSLITHPNTAPFVCKQLIQRLVTSNPSPGYVHRVAQVFTQQKSSPTQLGAVVRTILTDYEARSPTVLGNVGYGKIKEPVIRAATFFRALNAAAPNGRYLDSYFGVASTSEAFTSFPGLLVARLGQLPLTSPTVFNFFSPTYSPPGAMAAAGLVAPELEITDSYSAIIVPNQLTNYLTRNLATLRQPPTGPSPYIELDYSAFLPNAKNSTALVDQVDLLFCANQMPAATRTKLIAALNALPASTTDLTRVQWALQFAYTLPCGALQK